MKRAPTFVRTPRAFICVSAAIYLTLIVHGSQTFGSDPVKRPIIKTDEAPGLGDPGKLMSLTIKTGRSDQSDFKLAGRDSAQQIVIVGNYDSGQVRDLTRSVKFAAEPKGFVAIDQTATSRQFQMDR